MLSYYISEINYKISQPSEQAANQFLLSFFIAEYLFSSVHAIADLKKQGVKATDYSLLKEMV